MYLEKEGGREGGREGEREGGRERERERERRSQRERSAGSLLSHCRLCSMIIDIDSSNIAAGSAR